MSEMLPVIRKAITAGNLQSLVETVDQLEKASNLLNDFLILHNKSEQQGNFLLGSLFSVAECITAPHIMRIRLLPTSSVRPQLRKLLLDRASLMDSEMIQDPLMAYLEAKFPRLHLWALDVMSRPSAVSTFDEALVHAAIVKALSPYE